MSVLVTTVILILTIFILVIIHELGHFLMAKKFGIKVLEFGFGLPPRVFGKKLGETLVSLNYLPFGGFVKLLGEDDTSTISGHGSDKRSFANQSVWRRISVVVAGVAMNLLLAWILFWGILYYQNFRYQIPLLFPYKFVGVNQTNEEIILIGDVAGNSPAKNADIKSGDRVVAFNDQFIGSEQELIDKTKALAGQKIKLTLSDPEKQKFKVVEVTPRLNPPTGQGPLGVSLGHFTEADLYYSSIWQKILSAPVHSFNLVAYSVQILSKTIALGFQTNNFSEVSKNVAGPIGLYSIVGIIINSPHPILRYVDVVLAGLSLNLAIINILPFPGLDGGRLLFLVVEAIIRKRVHPTFEKYIHTIGLAVVLALILLVTYSDIRKLVF